MKDMNGIKIIGVDHGYGNIKTANCCFPTGIAGYDSEPLFTADMLVYEDRYYLIGEGHKEFLHWHFFHIAPPAVHILQSLIAKTGFIYFTLHCACLSIKIEAGNRKYPCQMYLENSTCETEGADEQ